MSYHQLQLDKQKLNRLVLNPNIPEIGTSLSQILWYYSTDVVARGILGIFWAFIVAFVKQFWALEYGLKISGIDNDFLFFKSLPDRVDYREIFYRVVEALEEPSTTVCDLGKSKGWGFVASPFRSLVQSTKHFSKLRSEFAIGKALYIAFWVTRLENFISLFEQVSTKILVVFADMQILDNALVQYFRTRDTVTCTMQHGLYVDYSGEDTLEVINYENVVSDYFLAWGERTAQLIERYHPDCKSVILGSPKAYDFNGDYKDAILLIMDHSQFMDRNRKLLSIAEDLVCNLGLSIDIKLHPYDKGREDLFSIQGGHFIEKVEHRYRMVIGGNSTYLVELDAMGMPVVSLESSAPGLDFGSNTFDSAQAIDSHIQDPSSLAKISSSFFDCVSDVAIVNHRSFLSDLLEKTQR